MPRSSYTSSSSSCFLLYRPFLSAYTTTTTTTTTSSIPSCCGKVFRAFIITVGATIICGNSTRCRCQVVVHSFQQQQQQQQQRSLHYHSSGCSSSTYRLLQHHHQHQQEEQQHQGRQVLVQQQQQHRSKQTSIIRRSGKILSSSRRKMTTASTTTTTTATTSETTKKKKKYLVIDPFCYRQFKEHKEASSKYGGTVFEQTVEEFEDIVNERYVKALIELQSEKSDSSSSELSSSDSSSKKLFFLVDGYAPFCKHFFIMNDFSTNAVVNVLPITEENESLLRTKYEARNDQELPVLIRYFPKEKLVGTPRDGSNSSNPQLPVAKYLDLILYSREQIMKENIAQGREESPYPEAPWGIVSIKAQDVNYEIPMTPITAMRNALGKEEGGSGVPLNRTSYIQAVEYWNNHAVVS